MGACCNEPANSMETKLAILKSARKIDPYPSHRLLRPAAGTIRLKIRALTASTRPVPELTGLTVKIIHLAYLAGLGGLQNSVWRLAEAQARRGFEVQLMHTPWDHSAPEFYPGTSRIPWDLDRVRSFDLIHSHGGAGLSEQQDSPRN